MGGRGERVTALKAAVACSVQASMSMGTVAGAGWVPLSALAVGWIAIAFPFFDLAATPGVLKQGEVASVQKLAREMNEGPKRSGLRYRKKRNKGSQMPAGVLWKTERKSVIKLR